MTRENMMKALSRNKKIIIHSIRTPGPSNFFDPENYCFLDKKHVFELIERGIAKLEIANIPYIILIDASRGTYYDTTTEYYISESQAKKLCDSGVAELRLKPSESSLVAGEKHDNIKEKVLIGATAAGGTTAVAAGAASVPFLAGFTSSGIAAGSLAAGIQSTLGSVAASSGFAALQSIAATTVIGTALPVAVAGAAVAGTAAAGVMLHKHRKRKKMRQNQADLLQSAQKGMSHYSKGGMHAEDMTDGLIYEDDSMPQAVLYDSTPLLPPRYDDIDSAHHRPSIEAGQPPAYEYRSQEQDGKSVI